MRRMAPGLASAVESDIDMLNILDAIIQDTLVKLLTSVRYALGDSDGAMC